MTIEVEDLPTSNVYWLCEEDVPPGVTGTAFRIEHLIDREGRHVTTLPANYTGGRAAFVSECGQEFTVALERLSFADGDA